MMMIIIMIYKSWEENLFQSVHLSRFSRRSQELHEKMVLPAMMMMMDPEKGWEFKAQDGEVLYKMRNEISNVVFFGSLGQM